LFTTLTMPSSTAATRELSVAQNVIDAVETAAAVLEELSNLGPQLDRAKVQQQCETVLAKLQVRCACIAPLDPV
jgi:hypothetical protein